MSINESAIEKLNGQEFTLDLSYFYNLDSENKICFDCGGPLPTCVSINNGVFLCSKCGINHQKLNYNISYIHQINHPWDPYLLCYAIRGGNSRMKRLCLKYEIECESLTENDEQKLQKYLTRLGEYHRLLLKSEITAEEPPEILYNDVAKDPCNINNNYFPEFQNYQLYKGDIKCISNKNVENNNMGSKIWEGTKNTFDVVKNTTGFIYKTSKPVVNFLGKTAFNGLKFIGKSLWNYYMNNGNNNNENDNTPIQNNNFKNNNEDTNNNYNCNNITNAGLNNCYQNIQNNNNINNNNYVNKNSNNYINKNSLSNSNKFNIFTINDENNKEIRHVNENSYQINRNESDNNQIYKYYNDINCINNNSISNISFYMNNKNNSSNSNTNSNFDKKASILNHENIIINDNYLKNIEYQFYNADKGKNVINNNESINDKNVNISIPRNNYPNFSQFVNNDNKNEIITNREINNKNIPNIVGEESYQEKQYYPLYQSKCLNELNSFSPVGIDNNNDNKF